MNALMKNWKTGITGLFGTVVFAAYMAHLIFGWGKVDAGALTAFGLALTAYQGWVSKDFDKGSNADAEVADKVVRDAVTISGPQAPRSETKANSVKAD